MWVQLSWRGQTWQYPSVRHAIGGIQCRLYATVDCKDHRRALWWKAHREYLRDDLDPNQAQKKARSWVCPNQHELHQTRLDRKVLKQEFMATCGKKYKKHFRSKDQTRDK